MDITPPLKDDGISLKHFLETVWLRKKTEAQEDFFGASIQKPKNYAKKQE